MKEFNFDSGIVRRNTGCVKWDEPVGDIDMSDMIPMWVADMDFETAPAVMDAVMKRAIHGAYGYTIVPDSFYEAVINWWQRRHGVTWLREWILYVPGVVPAISAILKALTLPGEKCLIQTPVYNCFFSSIRNSGLEANMSPLRRKDLSPREFTYEVDWADFEERAADERTTVFLLCNPHNPSGRVWTRTELEKMLEICSKHNVRVISDEIHCDLTMPGIEYTPLSAIDADNTVICCAPTKTFNIAGLQIANIVCADFETRRRINRAVNINEICDVNPFGVAALQAAYNEGEPWLIALQAYLYENYLTLKAWMAVNLPDCPVARLEGTYLVWIDVSRITKDDRLFCHRLLRSQHVWFNEGQMYGKDGKGYIRINIACPRRQLMEALKRLAAGVKTGGPA